MGRASRRKHENRVRSDRPRWAGAPGFDRAYRIAERFTQAYPQMREVVDTPYVEFSPESAATMTKVEVTAQIARLEAIKDITGFQLDLLDRQYATIRSAARHRGIPEPEEKPAGPSRPLDKVERDPATYLPYAHALATLAEDNMARMREATPIVFDPLGVPEPSTDALAGLGLPFPVVVADFLSPAGLSLPVEGLAGSDDQWVGLVAATIAQTDPEGAVDVWPTVTTLHARSDDSSQVPSELMFGLIRFGAPLPPAPEGLLHVALDDCEAWVVDISDPKPWVALWLRSPALAAISALRLLDAVNVDLADVPLPRPARRRAARENAQPALIVNVRSSHSGSTATGNGATVGWRQRWTVRGHWKHFGEHTAVARRHPSRVLEVPGHGRCVKVWCPPHVKGPDDKPLILKSRFVAPEKDSGALA